VKYPHLTTLLAFFTLGCSSLSAAEFRIVSALSDHMVLQREKPVAVCGWADAGESVTVSFAGQSKSATAGTDGKWSLKLDALATSDESRTLVVTGKDGHKVEVKDVLVGEYWLGSGQSNLAMTVAGCYHFDAEKAAAKFPLIRHYRENSGPAEKPQAEGKGASEKAKANGTPFVVPAPKDPLAMHKLKGGPAGLFNGKVVNLVPYTLRGMLWYQGEDNANTNTGLYHKQLTQFVTRWRTLWQDEVPFAWVQLPNYTSPGEGWPRVRESMLKTLALPKTGMAITIDLGDANDIHSKNKQDVGKRLSLWALGTVYGKNVPATSGLTVLVETSDNIGGGATGDGTGLLRALIECEVANSAICIADPVAMKAASAASIGSTVTLSIGGKGSRLDAGPVDLEVEVISLSDGRFELEDKQSHLASMCGDRFDMGPSAVVRHAGITILLTSIKTPPFDLGQWRSQGIEPSQFSVICVKAAVAHRRAYDPIAARMFWVDTPGPCSSNLKTLPYKHIRRPIYPLDS